MCMIARDFAPRVSYIATANRDRVPSFLFGTCKIADSM